MTPNDPLAKTPADPWSKTTKDRWFFAGLALSGLAMAWVLSPYMVVLLFAATATVVTWPVYESMRVWTGGRNGLAAILTGLVLAIWVIVPLGFLVYLFAAEAIVVVQSAIDLVQNGDLESTARQWSGKVWTPEISDAVGKYLPPDFDPLTAVLDPIRRAALQILNKLGGALPQIVNTVVGGGINAVIFVITTMTLYVEGPKILEMARELSPMEDRYERRLFDVFREFARNLVLGSLATAFVQGLIATIGYKIAGADRVLFLGTLTAVFSFFPVVGAMVVWVPVAIYVARESGVGWGIFVGVWSVLFTGTADNVLKPLFLRGSSNIHPVLIFLSVFGGLSLIGLPGVFVGPVCVAFFLALYKIYREDYLGIPPPVEPPPKPGLLAKLRARITGKPLPTVMVPEGAGAMNPLPGGPPTVGTQGAPQIVVPGTPEPAQPRLAAPSETTLAGRVESAAAAVKSPTTSVVPEFDEPDER